MLRKKYLVLIISISLFMILCQSAKADNYTDGDKGIKNQYIVVLKSTASNQVLNFLVEELTTKGVKIIAIYDQPILKGFAFSSDNTTLTNSIIEYLNNQIEVEYVIPDKKAVIF